jgi:hypothetical protein
MDGARFVYSRMEFSSADELRTFFVESCGFVFLRSLTVGPFNEYFVQGC